MNLGFGHGVVAVVVAITHGMVTAWLGFVRKKELLALIIL